MPEGELPQNPELTLTEQELHERLGWFTQVRWGAGICALAFLAIGWYLFNVRFEWKPALAVIGALFTYNLVFSLWAGRLYRQKRFRRRGIATMAHAQVTLDLLAVAALVYTIGGVENHFIILFIFPMIVASEFFSPRAAYGYATLAAVLVNLIGWGGFFFYETHHHRLEVCSDALGQACEPLVAPGAGHHAVFVLQVCFVMTFAVYITVFIASSIAGRLRMREEELEAAYRDLKSLEEVKSRFMRKTSHELRAPVGAMQSLLKAVAMQIPENSPGRAAVDRAVARSESMLDLIDDLLRYSRLQASSAIEKFGPVDLAEVVKVSADLFRIPAEEKGVRFQVQTLGGRVSGVRDRLADLVNNLVSNAIRYTPSGGTVTVRLECTEKAALLTVSDTGIGIPPDELPHIFDEFFRGEGAKKTVQNGTGLGLTIVKRVVELHGGSIDVESRPGQGTTFRIRLPPCIG